MAPSKVLQDALWFVPQGYLFGCTMSTAGASATLTVAAGLAADSTGQRMMKLASSLAKTTGAWVAGAGGGLDTSTIAINTWYHWFVIFNPTTLAVDVVFSATATPAAGPSVMPAGFTMFRRIGAAKTNASSQWILFHQLGDEFLWDTMVNDVNAVAISTTALTPTISVPTGFQVLALLNANISNTAVTCVLFNSPDEVAQIAGVTNSSFRQPVASQNTPCALPPIRTNTAAQIRAVVDTAGGTYSIWTRGWIDTRGKLF